MKFATLSVVVPVAPIASSYGEAHSVAVSCVYYRRPVVTQSNIPVRYYASARIGLGL